MSTWNDKEIWELFMLNADACVGLPCPASCCSTKATSPAWMFLKCSCGCESIWPGQSPAVVFICDNQTPGNVSKIEPDRVWDKLQYICFAILVRTLHCLPLVEDSLTQPLPLTMTMTRNLTMTLPIKTSIDPQTEPEPNSYFAFPKCPHFNVL